MDKRWWRVISILFIVGLVYGYPEYVPISKAEMTDALKIYDEPTVLINTPKHLKANTNRVSLLNESFSDENFPPTGWSVIQTNTSMQSGFPCYWSRFTTPPYAVHSLPAAAGLWWSYHEQDEWLISPPIHLTGSSTNRYYLRYWFYGFLGARDSNHYYTKISTDNGNTWTVLYDLMVQTPGWNWYYEPLEIDLSRYADSTVQIAFHCQDGPANSGVSYVWFVDDVEIGYPFLNDMGVANLNGINTIPVVVADPDTYYIKIRNYGTNPQNSVLVSMAVENVVVDQIQVSLDTLASLDTFLVWTPTLAGDYTILFYTELTDDENPTNDTLYYEITVCPEYHSIPYSKDFNENWGEWGSNPPFCGWSIVDNGSESPKVWNRNDWYHGYLSNPNRSLAAVRYSPVEEQDEWLISPRLDCSVDTQYTLSYWHQYEGYRNANPDTGFVLISTDDGQTWTELTKYIGGVSKIISSGYQTHNITHLVRGENDVRVAFRYLAYNAARWMIDDFSVLYTPAYDAMPLAIDVSDTIFVNDTFEIAVKIVNSGRNELFAPWYVYCKIRNQLDSLIVAQTMQPNETLSLTFTKTIAEVDTYNIIAWTGYPTDEFRTNDTIIKRIKISGWRRMKDLPTQVSRKGVNAGGALETVGDIIYALRGNNSNEFYAYLPELDSWIRKKDMPFDYKPDGTLIPKKVKQGGSLVAYQNMLYAFKGGSTNEFWAYDIENDTWYRKTDIPKLYLNANKGKKVKAGAALTRYDTLIYALKGGNTHEFWVYYPSVDSWAARCSLVTPDKRKVKGGGALETLGDTIYAFVGGKTPFFYAYSPLNDNWVRKSDPTFDPRPVARAKRVVKDGGSLVAYQGKLYALKGGNTNHFGYYDVNGDTWYTLENIPGLKRVKAGGALSAYEGHIYAFKGGNLQEFWAYHIPEPTIDRIANDNAVRVNNNLMTNQDKRISHSLLKIVPNPSSHKTMLYYSVAKPSRVQIKLYNAIGNLIANLVDSNKSVGDYYLQLNTLNLSKGIYFVTCETESEQTKVKLIIQ